MLILDLDLQDGSKLLGLLYMDILYMERKSTLSYNHMNMVLLNNQHIPLD